MVEDPSPVSEFKFESSSTPGKFYTVTVEGESYDCTCPGFVYRKKCSHLEKAKNQKQIEPADEEEMAKDTTLKNLRKNLFPDKLYNTINSKFIQKIVDKSCEAAFQLGRIRDKGAVKPLIRLLNGEISSQYGGGLDFYTNVKEGSEKHDEFMEIDNEMVEKSIVSAANALGEIGDERAIEPLIKALEKALGSTPDPWSYRIYQA